MYMYMFMYMYVYMYMYMFMYMYMYTYNMDYLYIPFIDNGYVMINSISNHIPSHRYFSGENMCACERQLNSLVSHLQSVGAEGINRFHISIPA